MQHFVEKVFSDRSTQERFGKKEWLAFVWDFVHWVGYRIDAWGVAFIICLVACLLHDALSSSMLWLSVAMAAVYWLGYAVNDYFDAAVDAQDPAKGARNFFVSHPISKRAAQIGFLVIIALLFLPFVQFRVQGVSIFGICVCILWLYSAPPVRLRSRPGWDLLIHALFVQTFPYLVCLILIGARWTSLDYILLAINFLSSLSGQLAQQIRDLRVDSLTEGNFTTRVGRTVSLRCLKSVTLTVLLLTSLSLLSRVIPLAFAPLFLAALPSLGQRIVGNGTPLPRRVIHVSVTVALLYTALLAFSNL